MPGGSTCSKVYLTLVMSLAVRGQYWGTGYLEQWNPAPQSSWGSFGKRVNNRVVKYCHVQPKPKPKLGSVSSILSWSKHPPTPLSIVEDIRRSLHKLVNCQIAEFSTAQPQMCFCCQAQLSPSFYLHWTFTLNWSSSQHMIMFPAHQAWSLNLDFKSEYCSWHFCLLYHTFSVIRNTWNQPGLQLAAGV